MTALVLALTLAAGAAPGGARPLGDLRALEAWRAVASDSVSASLRRDADGSVCLDYDFNGVSGYAVLRQAIPVAWPRAFALRLRVKGRGPRNDLQVKLVDGSGDNVWWVNRTDWAPPRAPTDLVLKSGHFSFAWGPAKDRTLRETETFELAIVAREGGEGAVCLSRLVLEPREPDPASWPEPVARTRPGVLEVDLGRPRDLEGVVLEWPAGARGGRYELEASADGRLWRTLREGHTPGGVDVLHLPDTEARRLRVRHAAGAAPRLAVRDRRQWPDFNAALMELARHAPRGHTPRSLLGEQHYWALVGVDGGGERSALLSEDGALELGRGGYSVEPAVVTEDGGIVTWAGVSLEHTLRDRYLPMPEVRWRHPAFTLEVAAAADGPARSPALLARYALTNPGAAPRTLRLLLAVRPWQVNPPQQFLTTRGGASRVAALRWRSPALSVNGREGPAFAEPPARVTAAPFAGGLDLGALRAAAPLAALEDPLGLASALLEWELRLGPGETRVVSFTAPLGSGAPPAAGEPLEARLARVAAGWHVRLDRVELEVPAASREVTDTLRSALAQMLLSRDGPALRPGTRSYARTWIRDGAMMVAGLVRLGEVETAREFVDWFGGHVFPSGKVPCCVDARGADPVVENDSHGEYLYAVAEVFRHTGDRVFLARHWPNVRQVTAYQEELRQSTRGERPGLPVNVHGLMPPSISHEGYSDKPAYSYWDDYWALRGYKDAVEIARALGHGAEAAAWGRARDEFEAELGRSIELTAELAGQDVIAGAADRADFDPTSTTVALNPAQARVPRALLERTFERYFEESQARAAGERAWKDYTPYELRSVGALVRLGQPARAHAMLDFFLRDRRPAGWNQWAEVVLPDPREARFLGDMPHAWVASDYVRSVLDLFAYEREEDGALVIGAGLSERWVQGGVRVRGLSTAHGAVSWSLSPVAGGHVLEVAGGPAPPGGVRLAWPLPGPLPRATRDGVALRWDGRELRLPAGPVTVRLGAAR